MSFFNKLISKEHWTYKGRAMPALDGIRGLAFLLVLFAHISNRNDLLFIGAGKIGVWLFFVLSAFLLTNYFITKPSRVLSGFEWANYILRRSMRILPIYFFVLTLYFIAGYVIQDFQSLTKHFILLEGQGHFWTIAVEFKYYLILPLIIFFIIYILRLNPVLSILFTLVFVIFHQYLNPASSTVTSSISLLDYLPVFIFGSLAAVIHSKFKDINFSNKTRVTFDVMALTILIGILLSFPKVWSILISPVGRDVFYNHFVFYGLGFGALILFVIHGKGYIRRIFESKILCFCGTLSFSGYLIHPIIIAIYYRLFSENMTIFGTVFIIFFTFIIANILYRMIEVPTIKIKLTPKHKTSNLNPSAQKN